MNKKSTGMILFTILILMLCIWVFGIFSQFTNGFEGNLKAFYLTYKGEKILTENTKRIFKINEANRFDVTYVFDYLYEDEGCDSYYNVSVISNTSEGKAFNFTVNGETKTYEQNVDLSKAFTLEKHESFFVFTIPENSSLETILQTVYGGNVESPKISDFEDPYLFTLVVSLYDGSVTYNVDFTFSNYEGVMINLHKVVF